ncbi:hypothetical protein ACFL59_08535 [Planctomycetota bacterium]
MSKGIIYVNSAHESSRYLREAEASAKSFKRFIHDVTFVLYTNATAFHSGAFDHVKSASFDIPPRLQGTDHKNGQMVAKHSVLGETPFDKTLYLGSDTYALKPEVTSLFRLLDHFDLAAAHAPLRINTYWRNSSIPEIPVCFPEFNCDVVLYRKNDAVLSFLRQWRELYLEHAFQHPHDQGAFRYLAYFSKLRIAALPPEYNYRGRTVRSDTVILQNRKLLPAYIARKTGHVTLLRERARGLILRLLS